MTVLFDNLTLLPTEWKRDAVRPRVFNPSLLQDGKGWLFAYRVVAETELRRRIGLCRLDTEFNVIPGSQLPFSDFVRFENAAEMPPEASSWFADPRLYRLAGRLFMYWNSGWHEPRNFQFLQELDTDTLRPIGPPRELTLVGAERQKLEKNWVLFEADAIYAVYSVNPHRILSVDLTGNGPVTCADIALPLPNPGGHAQLHGGLRGGTPPQRCGGHFYSFCHSIENGADGYNYVASAYRFAASAPFAPTDMPIDKLTISIPEAERRTWPKLNPAVADIIYPAGAANVAGKWAISIGIDDERCGIALLSDAAVVATLRAVG